MKIIRQKKSVFIEATNQWDFDKELNECLRGKIEATVQVYGLFKAAILYTELEIEEDEPTIAEMFEKAGCGAKCGECPFYESPEDGRKKWTVCSGRKVNENSRACDAYYLGRRNNAKAG